MVSGCSEKRKKKKVSLIIDYSSQYTFPRYESGSRQSGRSSVRMRFGLA